ncbi:hypothetical protein CENSYa_0812 [Cenarchaeum symbiosum A]|uniref:Uncharacterized protein n=1 Tax=Cenarchaeum symbiosum (strain A) TaxID=414004 RepID=A0RVS8_CENSY|nr:hypothetical protein CENSYa_0812 [Cenarchaeum symbiosum A]
MKDIALRGVGHRLNRGNFHLIAFLSTDGLRACQRLSKIGSPARVPPGMLFFAHVIPTWYHPAWHARPTLHVDPEAGLRFSALYTAEHPLYSPSTSALCGRQHARASPPGAAARDACRSSGRTGLRGRRVLCSARRYGEKPVQGTALMIPRRAPCLLSR